MYILCRSFLTVESIWRQWAKQTFLSCCSYSVILFCNNHLVCKTGLQKTTHAAHIQTQKAISLKWKWAKLKGDVQGTLEHTVRDGGGGKCDIAVKEAFLQVPVQNCNRLLTMPSFTWDFSMTYLLIKSQFNNNLCLKFNNMVLFYFIFRAFHYPNCHFWTDSIARSPSWSF